MEVGMGMVPKRRSRRELEEAIEGLLTDYAASYNEWLQIYRQGSFSVPKDKIDKSGNAPTNRITL
jgi:hypothetical protein